jgi:hypothetical protein
VEFDRKHMMQLRGRKVSFAQLMLSIALIGIATVLALGTLVVTLFLDAVWVGRATIPLEFQVFALDDGKPIDGARVRLYEGNPEFEVITGPDGRAQVTINAVTAGRSSRISESRSVNYAWALDVSADGFKPVNEDLKNRTRDPRYHSDPVPPPIVFRMERVESSPADSALAPATPAR